jgi:hypothetical protein
MRSIKSFLILKMTVLIVAQSFFNTHAFAQNLSLDSLRSPRFGSFNISIGFLGYESLKPNNNVGYLKFTPYYSPKIDLGYEYIINSYKLGIEINAGLHKSGMRVTYDKSMKNDDIADSIKKSINGFFEKGEFGRYYLLTFNESIVYFRCTVNKYFVVSNKYISKISMGINRSAFQINPGRSSLDVMGGYKVGNRTEPYVESQINFNEKPNVNYNSSWYTALHFKYGVGQMLWKRLLMLELEYNQGLETLYTGTIVENEKYLNRKYTSTFSWRNNYLALNLQYGLGRWRKDKR